MAPGRHSTLARELAAARRAARDDLARPGDWLDGPQRVAIWSEARRRRSVSASHPDRLRRPDTGENLSGLPSTARDVIDRVVNSPGRLSREWAERAIAALGEEMYVEIVGVVAIAELIDRFADAIGEKRPELPDPVAGEPSRWRPDDVGDVGAWVAQTVAKQTANVGRALTLVPITNQTWRAVVNAHYARGPEFYELEWARALSRPQIELMAARITSLSECFY